MSEENSLNITFDQIGNGELKELVNDELIKLIADLRNPNKVAGSKRELVINISAAAPEKRKSAKIVYQVSSKLGKREGGECQIYIDGEGDEVKSALVPLNQPSFSFTEKTAS